MKNAIGTLLSAKVFKLLFIAVRGDFMNDEPLTEATVEMVLMGHPELIKPGLRFIEKREKINGAGIIDLVFEDVKLKKKSFS